VRIFTRNGFDRFDRYPRISGAVAADLLLRGGVVAPRPASPGVAPPKRDDLARLTGYRGPDMLPPADQGGPLLGRMDGV
jgi:hypothetical protein